MVSFIIIAEIWQQIIGTLVRTMVLRTEFPVRTRRPALGRDMSNELATEASLGRGNYRDNIVANNEYKYVAGDKVCD